MYEFNTLYIYRLSRLKMSALVNTTSATAPLAEFICPSEKTMKHAMELAVKHDRPIVMDYWLGSKAQTCMIGVKDAEIPGEQPEKLLVKSEDEYTSPIVKIFKVETEYIVMTENSLYVVDVKIPTRRISA
jgi:hypothetical protein